MELTTLADLIVAPAGLIGREPSGAAVTRILDGPGAVWRRTGVQRHLWPEDVELPLVVLDAGQQAEASL